MKAHFYLATGAALFALTTSPSSAQVYTETTDAGETLSTAATPTSVTGTLTTIDGTLSAANGGANDADLFEIHLDDPYTFSATTNNTLTNNSATPSGPGLDTALFLLDSSGHAIETNDDDPSGTTFTSTLPAGTSLTYNLPAGTYYLGISASGNEPVNSANDLLFQGYPGGDTTAVRGPASGINPTTLATFNSNASDDGNYGSYEIDLTNVASVGGATKAGVTVPEPPAWSMLLGGAAALYCFRRIKLARL